jgi:hypothetical protein
MTLISLSDLPRYTGSLEDLRHGAATMGAAAWRIKRAAEAIDTDFQLTANAYRAPEAERLFASSAVLPAVGAELHEASAEVRGALLEFANTVQELLSRLNSQRGMAAELHRTPLADPREPDRVMRSDAIRRAVDQIYVEFQEAERTAANRVNAACGHPTQYARFDTENPKHHVYGLSLDQLQQIDRPWGDPAKAGFGHGFVVDGAWGTVLGMKELATSGEAWSGLGKVMVGLASYSSFTAALPDDSLPEWLQEDRQMARDFAKAFVGWDHWDDDPSRAGGIVVFNALTLGAGPLSRLSATGRLPAGSGALAALASVGRRVDPTTYVGDVISNSVSMGVHFRRLNRLDPNMQLLPTGAVRYPTGVTLHPDGRLIYPGGVQLLPDDTFRFPDDAPIREISPNGTVRFSDGSTIHADPPLTPAAFKILWSEGGDLRKHYPHVDDARARKISEVMATVVSYTPWGQLNEATHAADPRADPEMEPYGPR